MKKILSLLLAVLMLVSVVPMAASAVTGTDSDAPFGYTYDTETGTAIIDKTQSAYNGLCNIPATVERTAFGSVIGTFTVTEINTNFFINSKDYTPYFTSVSLPATLITIQDGLFEPTLRSLKRINIKGENTTCSDSFIGCSKLIEFVVNENNPHLQAVDGILFSGKTIYRFPAAKALTDTTTYEVSDNITSIRQYCFYSASEITDIYVPSSVTSVGEGAFCASSITGVHFEKGSTYNYTKYKCVCGNCFSNITFCIEDEESLEPTCSTPGHTKGIRCDKTGEWFSGEEIPVVDHDYEKTSFIAANCVENAKDVYTCKYGCGESYEVEVDDTALGHTGGKATCMVQAVCSTCGESYGKLAYHRFGSYTLVEEATCTEDAKWISYCEYGCGEYKYATGAHATGHRLSDYQVSEEASCGKNAKETATCLNNCGMTDTREIEGTALTHSFTSYKESEAAACGKNAKETAACDNGCGLTDTRVVEGSALIHSFTSYKESEAAACGKNAMETAACDNGCGLTDTREKAGSALSHISDTPIRTNQVNASCTKAGSYVEVVNCKLCSYKLSSETKTIPVLAHSDENHDGKCDSCYTDTTVNCGHICHKGGIEGFFYKIARFFWKLFKTNEVCSCGMYHY